MGSNCVIISGGGGSGDDNTESIDALASKIDDSSPESANEGAAISTIDSKLSTEVALSNSNVVLIKSDYINQGNIHDNQTAIATQINASVDALQSCKEDYVDGSFSGMTDLNSCVGVLSAAIQTYAGSLATNIGAIFDSEISKTIKDVDDFISDTDNFGGFCSLKSYSSSSALETAKPAASNVDEFAIVSDANSELEPQTYKSDGSSWSPIIPVSYGRIWAAATPSDTGKSALLSAKTLAGNNLSAVDTIVLGAGTDNEEHYRIVEDGVGNFHYIPLSLPVRMNVSGSDKWGYRSQVPTDGDWVSALNGVWSTSGDEVFGTSSVSGSDNRAYSRTPDFTPGNQSLLVIEGLRGVIGAAAELEVRLYVAGNKYTSLQNDAGGEWDFLGIASTGLYINTAHDFEILLDASEGLFWRANRAGAWQKELVLSGITPAYVVRALSEKKGATNAQLILQSLIALTV